MKTILGEATYCDNGWSMGEKQNSVEKMVSCNNCIFRSKNKKDFVLPGCILSTPYLFCCNKKSITYNSPITDPFEDGCDECLNQEDFEKIKEMKYGLEETSEERRDRILRGSLEEE
jgi:hypothetical protein